MEVPYSPSGCPASCQPTGPDTKSVGNVDLWSHLVGHLQMPPLFLLAWKWDYLCQLLSTLVRAWEKRNALSLHMGPCPPPRLHACLKVRVAFRVLPRAYQQCQSTVCPPFALRCWCLLQPLAVEFMCGIPACCWCTVMLFHCISLLLVMFSLPAFLQLFGNVPAPLLLTFLGLELACVFMCFPNSAILESRVFCRGIIYQNSGFIPT